MSTDHPTRPGLTFRELDATAADTEDPERDLLHGWGQALARGFHEGRPTDEHQQVWIDAARADAVRFWGFWPERTTVASPTLPVATYASWTGGPDGGGLNVGGGTTVALHMITDVTVSPTHRRQGLLRSFVERDLTEAAERGLAVAALTATEGSIYGRFGFGAATQLRSVEVDVTERFALRPFTDDGSLELIEPAEAWDALQAVHATHLQQTRGAVAWPAIYESILTGRFSWESGGPDRKTRIVLHLDAEGRPDGYASYQHAGEQDGRRTVDVSSIACDSATGYLALWQFLGSIDLTERIRWGRAPLVDPLEWALVDPRCVSTTKLRDMLWIRVLDVVAALEARPWYADATVSIGLTDTVGLTDGTWRITVTEGRATVTRTDEHPEVSLTTETLGSLYLGGVDTATLQAAGRLSGDEAAMRRWSAMVDGGPAPYCTTAF